MLDGSLVGDYKTIFQDEHNYAFDELEGVYQIYKKHSFKMFEERIFADISKIYKRFRLALQDVNHDEQLFYWKDGHVFRAYYSDGTIYNDEFIYIHFKERKEMVVHDLSNDQKEFYITNTGFWKSSGNHITLQMCIRDRFIGKTIESVQNQTYQNWEMIIVDDCSTDNTDEVVDGYLSDKRIKYIKNEKNSGAAVSRNRALREAKGKWITFLDSDDLWLSLIHIF